jgi:hypothetical protein
MRFICLTLQEVRSGTIPSSAGKPWERELLWCGVWAAAMTGPQCGRGRKLCELKRCNNAAA